MPRNPSLRRLRALALLLFCSLVLAACAKEEASSSDDSSKTAKKAPAKKTPETQPDPTPDATADDPPLKAKDPYAGKTFALSSHYQPQGPAWLKALFEDTSSFALNVEEGDVFTSVQAALTAGTWPEASTVAVEGLLHHFKIVDGAPADGHPMAVALGAVAAPFNDHHLLRITIHAPEQDGNPDVATSVVASVTWNSDSVDQYRLFGFVNTEVVSASATTLTPVFKAGQHITAVYEIEVKEGDKPLGTLNIAYQTTSGDAKTITLPLERTLLKDVASADKDTRFAAAVASFGTLLKYREGANVNLVDGWTFTHIATLAADTADDTQADRQAFLELVTATQILNGEPPKEPAKPVAKGSGRKKPKTDLNAEEKAKISKVFNARKTDVAKCYNRVRNKTGVGGGTLSVLLVIESSGKVSNINLAQNDFGREMKSCITPKMQRWKFPTLKERVQVGKRWKF